MATSEESMQVTCEEIWIVNVGNEKTELTSKEVEILKAASTSGQRGIVWFKDRAISIPHIQSVTMKKRTYYRLQEGTKLQISKEVYEKHARALKG
jgi:hypothetical protein